MSNIYKICEVHHPDCENCPIYDQCPFPDPEDDFWELEFQTTDLSSKSD